MARSTSFRRRGAPLGLVLFGWASWGCTAILGIDQDYHLGAGGAGGAGGAVECETVADCPDTDECRVPVACTGGMCEMQDAPDGLAISEQTAGDCAVVVCDGQGSTRVQAEETDLPDDDDACTQDGCDGATPVFTPLGSVPCYDGPAGTAGVGVCQAGTRECGPNGDPGDCVGQVVPSTEDCLSPLDEDCDGSSNEDCTCTPGEAEPCYSGPPGTAGVGICVQGTHVCNQSGVGFGACTGQVTPLVEDCDADTNDEDCDGLVDESGPSCFCGDSKVSDGEECDDQGLATAGCDPDCTLPVCGDGFVNTEAGEECEDGNASDADACSSQCKEQKVLAVSAGDHHTCALLSGGVVKCWGKSSSGQLGLGDTESRGDQAGEMGAALPAVDLGLPAKAISAGDYHTCALLSNDQIKCWGQNATGQLGLGDTQNRGASPGQMGANLPPVALGNGIGAKAVSAGNSHTCAVLSDNTVKCWGFNLQGQLGLGDTAHRGDAPGEMGASLPAVSLASPVTAITAGNAATCALLTGGSLRCWGANVKGCLGLGDASPRGDQPGEMGASLPVVSLGSGLSATSAVASNEHTCAVLSNQALKCWGNNESAQLGVSGFPALGDAPGEMGDALPAVSLPVGLTAVRAAAGDVHTCLLRSDMALACWGASPFGQIGEAVDQRKGSPVSLGTGLTATDVEAGASHTCAILAGRLKCWGANADGQLGLGDIQNRGDDPGEMGDALPFVKLWNDQW